MVLVFLLLGFGASTLHGDTFKELPTPTVSVWPPGSEIYSGESVFLQCRMESNSTRTWTYQWYRNTSSTLSTSKYRHLVSGDSYSITAVEREDAGSYWCKAKPSESNFATEVQVVLNVSGMPPPLPTLAPSSRQFFGGERFSVQCPASRSASTRWKLRRFSPGQPDGIPIAQTQMCAPLDGANTSDLCVFSIDNGNSGLYWCEGAGRRSSAVNITVSYGDIILIAPPFPVYEGDRMVLSCQYKSGNHSRTVLFKNRVEIFRSNSSSSGKATNLTIDGVTPSDEGFYKCASHDGKMESPESWLSVTPVRGSWKWIIVSCSIGLLFLIPLIIWLIKCNGYRRFFTRNCWAFFKNDIPAMPLPATRQDGTEVQWDLSWKEMSNLLDKQTCPGT